MFGLAPDDGAGSDGASVGPPKPTLAMIQAEGEDMAVMWGGTVEAKARARDWVEKRLVGLGLSVEGAPSDRFAATSPAKAGRGERDEVFVIDGDNVAGARVFMGMASQWRVTSMSSMAGAIRIKEGLDYTALPVVAGALGLVLDADCFDTVQTLERVTLGLEADAANKRGKNRG